MCFADNPELVSHVPVGVRILDVNDNPPELARDYDVVVCENTKPGQVTLTAIFLPEIKNNCFVNATYVRSVEHVITCSDFTLASCT